MWVCYSRARLPEPTATHSASFGSSPKISTPVENIVEKRRLNVDFARKSLVLGRFSGGEAPPIAVLRASADAASRPRP